MHGCLPRAAVCATLLLSLVPVATASASNDNFDAAKPLFLGTEDMTVDNTIATVEAGETFTAQAVPGHELCQAGASASQADHTAWWWVSGTGRPLTVTAAGEGFDTHLAVFSGPKEGDASCQDARGPESITIPSVAGGVYRIQVGSCAVNTPDGCSPAGTGRLHVRATSPAPANDARAAPAPLPAGQAVTGDNYAASEEAGEIVSCGLLPYGRTVWYRFTAPSVGGARFTVTGANPSVAVFNQGGERLGCDATPGGDARVTLAKVPRGDLLVQVGGVGAHAGLVGDAIQSPFTVQAAFSESTDRDGDGTSNSRDCKPDDPKIHPGAKDIPGNRVDEDCTGRDASYPRIKARARLAVALSGRYARVRSLVAHHVPAGARVQLFCSGRTCPFRHSHARTIRRSSSVVSLMSARLRKARILPVTTFEVRVTRSGLVGSVVRYRFDRAGRRPVQRTLCLAPGAAKPGRC
jgi:hypothetical protein